ncbi:hypothetical protein AVEN_82408-1 [Araneus ventricosus]|uniref:Uncharacterized protein n=1 Tax=Araneus ventricosus TaxID=182803 RepID=A0A4Y2L1M4_ARAVE|nr:hypothetical protein AVEN_82408-1 [Araneus ventricosus]
MSHRAACPTGDSHLDVPSVGVSHRWLTLGCPIGRCVPPVAHTWMSHRWLTLLCPTWRRIPPVTRTWMSHQACPTHSHLMSIGECDPTGGSTYCTTMAASTGDSH